MPALTHNIHLDNSSNKDLTNYYLVLIAAVVYCNTKYNIKEHINTEQVVDRAN